MQIDLMAQLPLMLPELVIAVGALVLLMVGVYSKQQSYTMITTLAVVVLAAALVLLVVFPPYGNVFGDALIMDSYSRYMKVLTVIGALVALVMSVGYAKNYGFDKFEFPIIALLSTVGMMLMISAGNMLSLYMGLELQSLALYVLAAFNRDNARSSEAGLKYFVLGALSSGMLLYGISLVYGYTGHIGFMEIAQSFTGGHPPLGLIFGMVFVLAGLAFKISAVPFHMWTPDVYEGSPTPVTAFFAGAPKVAAIALIGRIVVMGFSPDHIGAQSSIMPAAQQILVFIAIASMILGAFAGIGQKNIKRLMAYSSITHMGYALVGLSAAAGAGSLEIATAGVQSIIIYMTIYLVTTLGAFAFILAMRNRDGNVEEISDLAGLAWSNPFMAAIMTMHMFSLASIPPLAGFFGKWYTFSAAVGAGLVPLAVIGMMASVVGAFYYLRLIKVMWFDESKGGFLALPSELRIVLFLSGVFGLFYVFFAVWITPWAATAAQSLFMAQ
ncbi:NADH-quinone oxidoreductase subunit NuoN [Bartonella sp. HY761]|uniref:NADH-quinone oxidoreductase subunit NuoN n=1 Tax=Bartonella sp. HY761 TaxID=2979330 RepID=UPI002202FAC4|nr:NADH-quinone oxidoreductase subunit NuoN [Bartonella sp. HY761]UXN05378.1 NADH-quinone oxidoreductase subunit NuoN [Bartonella sp. HY761]